MPDLRVDVIGNSARERGQFRDLYRSAIDEDDQVDPEMILQWSKQPGRTLTSPAELAQALKTPRHPSYHLLLGAWSGGRLAGFANVVIIPRARAAFLAYFAALPVHGLAGQVARAMIDRLDALKRQSGSRIDWIVFELAHSDAGTSRVAARARLFQRYLSEIGYATFKLDVPYRLPDLDEGGSNGPTRRADLVLAAPTWRLQASQPELSRSLVLRLLQGIYFDVYADALAGSQSAATYRLALERELAKLEREVKVVIGSIGMA